MLSYWQTQFDNMRDVDLSLADRYLTNTPSEENDSQFMTFQRFIEVLIINDTDIWDDILKSDQLMCFCLRPDREDRCRECLCVWEHFLVRQKYYEKAEDIFQHLEISRTWLVRYFNWMTDQVFNQCFNAVFHAVHDKS